MKFTELMEHEQEEIKKGVRFFDPANTGSVATADLGKILRWCKLIPTNAEISALAEQLDPSRTGRISLPFVYNAVANMWPSYPGELERRAWGAFLTFDKCDKGKITPEDLSKILLGFGLEPLPENEVKKIIKESIDRKDGLIEYGMLIREWLK
ncbi:hypothetical protein X801_02238 [Opisthorchis viverrini]|uniref:Uncharacterized protein n=2 Tax=Opisthorchis viverrini TaxID=6198 RepID=A0A1S8X5X3_OPIVI